MSSLIDRLRELAAEGVIKGVGADYSSRQRAGPPGAVQTAIALRFGIIEAALDGVFVAPTMGARWITHAWIVSLLS